jgi:hypothetical protein
MERFSRVFPSTLTINDILELPSIDGLDGITSMERFPSGTLKGRGRDRGRKTNLGLGKGMLIVVEKGVKGVEEVVGQNFLSGT